MAVTMDSIFYFFNVFMKMPDGSEDCWECRLTSGAGLLGMGGYVAYHSVKLKGFSRKGVAAIGCGLGIVGFLRLLALPPFKVRHKGEEKKIPETDENEYIIGKLPSKFP